MELIEKQNTAISELKKSLILEAKKRFLIEDLLKNSNGYFAKGKSSTNGRLMITNLINIGNNRSFLIRFETDSFLHQIEVKHSEFFQKEPIK